MCNKEKGRNARVSREDGEGGCEVWSYLGSPLPSEVATKLANINRGTHQTNFICTVRAAAAALAEAALVYTRLQNSYIGQRDVSSLRLPTHMCL